MNGPGPARAPGWPYLAHPHACSVESREHAFTAQFVAGFPELLAIHDFALDTLTGQYRDFFARAPFHRLRLIRNPSEFEWDSLNGPHLARLTELTLDQLTRELAARLLKSPLHGLTALRDEKGDAADGGQRKIGQEIFEREQIGRERL